MRLLDFDLDSGFGFEIRVWRCSARFYTSCFRCPARLSCDCPLPALDVFGFQLLVSDLGWGLLRSLLNIRFPISSRALVRFWLQPGSQFPVSQSGSDLLCSFLSFWFLSSSQALVRLPCSSPDSCFQVQIQVLSCSALFTTFRFQLPAGLSYDCLAPARILVPAFRFPVSDSSLDPVRLLLIVLFPVSRRALVRLFGSSPDSAFWFTVSVDLVCSILDWQFAVSKWAIAGLHPGFWLLVSGFRFWFELLRSLLNFWSLASDQALARLPGSSQDSCWRFQIPFWTCSARFSMSSFWFPAMLSFDCHAPSHILVSFSGFQF